MDKNEELLAWLTKTLRDNSIRPEYRVMAGSILLGDNAKWASARGTSAGIAHAEKATAIRDTLREMALLGAAEELPGESKPEDSTFKACLSAAGLVLL